MRVVIEAVAPVVDGGRFPIKRVIGDSVEIEADCFADGHDVVACALLWRRGGDAAWQRTPMAPLGNDRWRAGFVADALGAWQYTVQAWVDPFLSWRHDFARRIDADDVLLAARAGAALLEEAAARAAGADAERLRQAARALAEAARRGAKVAELKRIGLDEALGRVAERHPDLRHALTARHGATACWSSASGRASRAGTSSSRARPPTMPARHGSFADCEAWLPYVQRMGFDVVYFPPIHPIGRMRRKGRNNTLEPAPDDVGSPWAIGAAEGGHEAILGELGTPGGLPPAAAARRRAGHRDRARHRVPVRARPSVGEPASGMVSQARRRQHPVRREPAQEVPGHLPLRLRERTSGASCGWRSPA